MPFPDNPICAAMGWTVPASDEVLTIAVEGVPRARLTPRSAGYSEGVYLIDAGYGVPNSCCAVAYYPVETIDKRARRALARKLFANARNIKAGELDVLVSRLSTVTVTVEKRNRHV